jgi:O-antigen/teichoic acid export membrane protein
MRRFWHRPLGSKLILVLNLVLLGVFLIAPWQRPCQVRSDPDDPLICGRTFAWEGSDVGIYAMLLAVAILIWELLPVLIPRLGMRGWPTAIVTALLSIALAVCTLTKLIKDNEFQTVWAWVAFALTLAIMLTALIRVRFRWETRNKPGPAVEPAGSTPAPGSGS